MNILKQRMIYLQKTRFTFDSLTAAQNAKKILLSKGVSAEVVKTTQKQSRKGCSYSVATDNGNVARHIFSEAGIKYKGVY